MLNKIYTPVTLIFAVITFFAGEITLSNVLFQITTVAIVIFREPIAKRVARDIDWSVNGAAANIIVMIASMLLAIGPLAPFWTTDELERNRATEQPIFWTGIVYGVLVVWNINRWKGIASVSNTYDIQVKDLLEKEYAKFPNAKGWSTTHEIAHRFNLPLTGDFTAENIIGVHIGNAIHWNELGHILTVGGSGQGKGACLVLPALLSDGLVRAGISVVCLDPKGENAAVAAPHLKRAGYDVHVVNPLGIKEITHLGNSRWNPFDLVEADEAKRACDMLAFSLYNVKSGGDGDFFNERCRQYISLYMRFVLFLNNKYPRGEGDAKPAIGDVYNFLMLSGEKREKLLAKMANEDGFAGKASAEAILGRLLSTASKTEEGIFSTIEKAINILDSESLQYSLSDSDFDMRQIAYKPTAIFVCLKHSLLSDYAPWVRMFFDTLLNTLTDHYNPNRKVLVPLDEFPQLGYLNQFAKAPAVLRGYNVTLWPIVQQIGQLQQFYGKDWETFINNTVIKHWFGGNGGTVDNTTAEYIVKRLPKTVEVNYDENHKPHAREVPLLDMSGFIHYPKIVGEIYKLPAQIEIEKVPYWQLKFAKDNASQNPFYN